MENISKLIQELEDRVVEYVKRFNHLDQVFNKGEDTFEYFENYLNDEGTTDELLEFIGKTDSDKRVSVAEAIDICRKRYILIKKYKGRLNFEYFEGIFGWSAEQMADVLHKDDHVVLISGHRLNYTMYFFQGFDIYRLEISPTNYHLTNILTEKKVWGKIESCNMVKTGHSCSEPNFEIPPMMWKLLDKYCYIISK